MLNLLEFLGRILVGWGRKSKVKHEDEGLRFQQWKHISEATRSPLGVPGCDPLFSYLFSS